MVLNKKIKQKRGKDAIFMTVNSDIKKTRILGRADVSLIFKMIKDSNALISKQDRKYIDGKNSFADKIINLTSFYCHTQDIITLLTL